MGSHSNFQYQREAPSRVAVLLFPAIQTLRSFSAGIRFGIALPPRTVSHVCLSTGLNHLLNTDTSGNLN